MTLKDQGHRSKANGTMRFLNLKNIYLDAKIIIQSGLVGKLWSKTSFCIMVTNVTCSCTFHVETALDVCFFYLCKGPDPSYLVLKFDDRLSSRNLDITQSVIVVNCDLERSRFT